MPLGTNHVTTTTVATFIPEKWSTDIVATFMLNRVLANRVESDTYDGPGDTYHIPSPTRASASAVSQTAEPTLTADNESEVVVSIDKHYSIDRLWSDRAKFQGIASFQKFYINDAGYGLSVQVDSDLHALGAGLQGGSSYSAAVIGSDGSTTYTGTNAAALTDAGIRRVIQTLDDSDVPMMDRSLVVPPVEKNNLLGIERFTEQAFSGYSSENSPILTGVFGEIYGVPVFVSTNAATANIASPNDGARIALLIHRSAFILITQLDVRVQQQYLLQRKGTLFSADTLYGVQELRDYAGVAIAVPA